MSSPTTICPSCGKTIDIENITFCPFCGSPIHSEGKTEEPKEIQQLLTAIEKEEDPVKKHRQLNEALQTYPSSLSLNHALLMLGRLHERNSKVLDFSVIKCFLLQMYLTPKQFTEEKTKNMRTELFEAPQLKRCLELAPNQTEYMKSYLEQISEQFIDIFLKGNTRYTRSFFGFNFDRRYGKLLAEPAAKMMLNMHQDTELSSEQRDMLYSSFYRAFAHTLSDTAWLDELLQQNALSVPALK